MKLESIALHEGYKSEETTKAAAVPIYQTTSFTFDDTQHGADLFNLAVPGNIYTRIMNPTTDVLEQRIAAMEGGVGALAVASGMAAALFFFVPGRPAADAAPEACPSSGVASSPSSAVALGAFSGSSASEGGSSSSSSSSSVAIAIRCSSLVRFASLGKSAGRT